MWAHECNFGKTETKDKYLYNEMQNNYRNVINKVFPEISKLLWGGSINDVRGRGGEGVTKS